MYLHACSVYHPSSRDSKTGSAPIPRLFSGEGMVGAGLGQGWAAMGTAWDGHGCRWPPPEQAWRGLPQGSWPPAFSSRGRRLLPPSPSRWSPPHHGPLTIQPHSSACWESNSVLKAAPGPPDLFARASLSGSHPSPREVVEGSGLQVFLLDLCHRCRCQQMQLGAGVGTRARLQGVGLDACHV